MAKPNVWTLLPAFDVYPKITFFGLDKSQAHCFTLHKETTNKYKSYFKLQEGKLQKKIIFVIGDKPYPAEVRLVCIDRSRVYKLKPESLPKREVIQFQWKRFKSTQKAIINNSQDIYELVKNTKKNNSYKIKFNHLEDNVFLLRFGVTESVERKLSFLKEIRK